MSVNSFRKWSLITIGTVFCLIVRTNGCVQSKQCLCYSEGLDSEYQCPRDDPKLDIKVTSDNVDMQCITSPYSLDINILPNFDAHEKKQFMLKYCDLNSTFTDILKKYNMTQVTSLYFEQSGSNSQRNLIVSKDLFKGLETLTTLSLTYSTPNLEKNFLENLPNLRILYLNTNRLVRVDNYFEATPHLLLLDLSRNQIESLSHEGFKNLKKLQRLHLWYNNLTALQRSMFKGLEKLELLELSDNHIELLPEDTFLDLHNLVNVSLRSNRIKYVYSKIFSNNPLLKNVRLSHNSDLTLQDYVFANLTELQNVELRNNNLQFIPENLFRNSSHIQEISLQKNLLKELPDNLFQGLKKLQKLNLSENKLKSLSEQIFSSLEILTELLLNNNHLEAITGMPFAKLRKLQKLNLSNNKITIIEETVFTGLDNSLTFLDLSYNRYGDNINDNSPFSSCVKLRTVILHHNALRSIPFDPALHNIEILNISYNKIDKIEIGSYAKSNKMNMDLSNNEIKNVGFTLAEVIAKNNYYENTKFVETTVININNNPILCDCSNYDLIQYNNGAFKTLRLLMEIQQDELRCSNAKNVLVQDLKMSDIDCPLSIGCPNNCTCSYRPYDKAAIVDCSFRNLTSYPLFYINITKNHHYQQTILNLTGNELTDGPTEALNYENITYLDLSQNKINRFTWIPPYLKELCLDRNKLENLKTPVIHLLKKTSSLRRLSLKDNPWVCDCNALEFQNYLIDNYQKVNTSDIYCHNSNIQLVKIKQICKTSPYLTILLPIFLSVLLCFAVLFALYYRYQTEIKIYLYAKNLCLWFVSEEELDKDKIYDVFISYSHQDEDFVHTNLLPKLENGDTPFKTCIHVRDWIPGKFITEQIFNSIKDSRRTLVVLSNNFVDSVWGKLEFRAAHAEAISEGRARVIVVIYGELDEKKLDHELKGYLNTNTYLKWGDQYFWNKLRYAMPHSKPGFYKRNTKMMLKIDDKFKLMSPSPTVTSTPPITLDPSLLNGKEIKLDIPKQTNGEAPLMVQRC